MKRKLLTVTILVLVIGLLLAILPWGRTICLRTTAYEYALDQAESLATHTITIDGRFTRRLFRENVFQGQMEVSGFPETDGASVYIQFWDDMDYGGLISYQQDGVPVWDTPLKRIYTNLDFSVFVIQLFEVSQDGDGVRGTWDGETGRVLTTAPDREVLTELFSSLGMVS